MLNNIKSLILEKKSYMEAANLILEDTSLDDSIILDESPEEPEVDPVPEEQPEEVPAEQPAEDPAEDPAGVTDLDPAASELPNADGNELPEPVAAPTGEPVSDDSVDLMTVEIDPVSNTVKDTIPVAPANAADAVEGEPAAQPVDQPVEPEAVPPVAATGDVENITSPEVPAENDVDMMNDSLDDEPAEAPKDESAVESDPDSVDLMSESISIDDAPADDAAAAEAPADAGVEDLGTGEEPKQDNTVTAAVKDKVEELEAQDEPAADTGAASDGKEELMKKLSALTKSIEDAKALVMSKVQ